MYKYARRVWIVLELKKKRSLLFFPFPCFYVFVYTIIFSFQGKPFFSQFRRTRRRIVIIRSRIRTRTHRTRIEGLLAIEVPCRKKKKMSTQAEINK